MRRHISIACVLLVAMPAVTLAQMGQPGEPPADQTTAPAPSPGPDAAAQRAIHNAIPLTPDMIQQLEKRYGDAQQAQEQATQQVASPVSRMISATFSPGQATSIVQTVRGYPTAISFFDATGQPSPISWNTNSNAANVSGGTNCNSTQSGGSASSPAVNAVGFYVCVPTRGSNTIEITPMSLVPRGGLVVSLETSPKPLSFLLMTGAGRYDADLSVHVASRGPNAKVLVDTREGAPVTGASYLNDLLAGVPPADAIPLEVYDVSPDEVQAWRMGGETFIRTSDSILVMSPAHNLFQAGAGGTAIYGIPNTPVVVLSVNSRTVSASLKESH